MDCGCKENDDGLIVQFCRGCAAELKQRTRDWYQARCGFATASKVADLTRTTKTGWSTKRDHYMDQLLAERLTGRPQGIKSIRSLDDRADMEPKARDTYSFDYNRKVVEVGFIHHLFIERAGASPDGYVGDDGMIEIKSLDAAQHIKLLEGGKRERDILDEYIPQIRFGLACSSREWCDFVSYCPSMLDEKLKLYVKTYWRDEDEISKLECAVKVFLSELDEKVALIKRRGSPDYQDDVLTTQLEDSIQLARKPNVVHGRKQRVVQLVK